MRNAKPIAVGLFALFAFVITAFGASAYYYPSTPYSGINTIGTSWAPMNTGFVSYDWGYTRSYYDYALPARSGGWYGSGSEFLVGLRPGVYAPVPVQRYTSFYADACTWPHCRLGAAGYPRARLSQFR
jgi:hypothetical protein